MEVEYLYLRGKRPRSGLDSIARIQKGVPEHVRRKKKPVDR